MKGDLPASAVHLLSTCTVRTHERKDYFHIQGSKETKPIRINGRRYESIMDVKRSFSVGSKTVEKWLASGYAVRI